MKARITRLAALAAGTALGATALPGAASAQQWTDESIRAAFAEADVNHDGYVDVDEFVGRTVLLFKQADTNDDRVITAEEVKNVTPGRFKNADRNGDGKLSLGEAVGAKMIDYFEIDANHDGVITVEEILVYEPIVAAAAKRK